MAAAQSNLQQILLAMRKLLHLPRLEYVSIQNQADFLIEVPVEVTDVPKVSVLFISGTAMSLGFGYLQAIDACMP